MRCPSYTLKPPFSQSKNPISTDRPEPVQLNKQFAIINIFRQLTLHSVTSGTNHFRTGCDDYTMSVVATDGEFWTSDI